MIAQQSIIKSKEQQQISLIVAEAEAEISRLVGYEVRVNYERSLVGLGKDYLATRKDRIFELIISTVCDVLSVPKQSATVRLRHKEYVEARHIICYLAKDIYRVASPKKIGLRLGGRERTTIIWAANTAQDLIDTDKRFQQTVQLCKAEIDILLQLGTP